MSPLSFKLPIALLFSLVLSGSATSSEWKIIKHKDRDYVGGNQFAEFYKFKFVRDGQKALFSSPTMKMEAVLDSDEVRLNGTTFMLSFPITQQGRDVLISRIDLCRMLDPVFRPSYIEEATRFDTVVIDPGHGGRDSGSKGVHAFEKVYTMDLAKKLWRQLVLRGFTVQFTRHGDEHVPLRERVARANTHQNAIFVSLHFNAHHSRGARGLETYAVTPPGAPTSGEYKAQPEAWKGNLFDANSIALAAAVHSSALKLTKARDRGVRRARFHVLRGLTMPGILFEGGYITNPEEGGKVDQDTYRYLLAKSIADGIDTYRSVLRKKK